MLLLLLLLLLLYILRTCTMAATCSIAVGDAFDSFQDFRDKLHQIEKQSDILFTVGECKTVENANKSIKQPDKQYKACFKYRYIKLLCKHFGKPRPNNQLTGTRPNQR